MKLGITLLFFIAFSALGLAAVFFLTGFSTGTLMWSMIGIAILFTIVASLGVRRIWEQEAASS